MEGWREKDTGGEEGGRSFRWKDTPEMARCRECSSVERDLSCLWLAACVCVWVWGSQYRNAHQHALPFSSQLCSARSFKANRKQTINLVLCFSSMRQNEDKKRSCFYTIMFTVKSYTFSRNAFDHDKSFYTATNCLFGGMICVAQQNDTWILPGQATPIVPKFKLCWDSSLGGMFVTETGNESMDAFLRRHALILKL